MTINPSEITKLLKDQIKNFGEKAEVSEIGKVLSVGDGIARVYGLDNVQAGEMVEFEDGSKTDQEDSGFSVSYTMGSMSLTAAANSSDNVGGTSGTDDTHKEIGLAFTF